MPELQDTVTFAKGLKDFYLPTMRHQLNLSVVGLYRFEKNTESIVGKQGVIDMITSYTNAATRDENEILPTAGATAVDQAFIKVKLHYAPISFSGLAIASSRNREGAFSSVVAVEMRSATESMKKLINRELYLDGQGILALIDGTGPFNPNAIPVDAAGGIPNDKNGAKYIQSGFKITAYSQSEAKRSGTMHVLGANRDSDPNTIKVDLVPSGLSNNDKLRMEDSKATTEFQGLYAFCAQKNNVIQGIDRSDDANDYFRPAVLDNNGVTWDFFLESIEALDQAVEIRSGSRITVIYMPYALRRKAIAELTADKQFTDQFTLKLPGGHRAIDFNGLPLIPDVDMVDGTIFGLNEEVYAIYTMYPGLFDWISEDPGGIIHRSRERKDAYEAELHGYFALGCSKPNASGAIINLRQF